MSDGRRFGGVVTGEMCNRCKCDDGEMSHSGGRGLMGTVGAEVWWMNIVFELCPVDSMR